MMFLLEWNLSNKLNDHSLLDVYFYESVCAVHTHTQAYIYIYIYIYIFIYTHTHIHIYIYMCVCVYVCLLDFLPYCITI